MPLVQHSVPDGYADRPGPEKQPVTSDGVTEAATTTTDNTADTRRVPFGRPMRALFEFAPTFRPLNHGSFGTFPAAVRRVREHHLHLYEARPDLYRYFEHPRLYNASRAALQPLFGPGVHADELALVANATTGVNVVLTNLVAQWSTEEEEAVRHAPDRDERADLARLRAAGRPASSRHCASHAPSTTYFTNLFQDVGTMDYSPWVCIPAALAFRRDVCGGEEAIRAYCFGLAREGGDRAAAILGTEVLDNPRSALRECCLVNVRLPLAIEPEGGDADEDGAAAASTTATTTTTTSVLPRAELQAAFDWMRLRAAEESDTYFQILLYQGAFWVRFSAQIYLELADFEWGARVLLDLCKRVQQGEYKAAKKD
ncbi:aminotransferase family protein [Niveomyces insectorum RCEF 264]|uniref:Aminotransferase family protein n=1 Tax=Niveomyces insectorum RCEF 264 TaxID=1081102 RepID=A0A167P718_9HYPO|nr:aminotransferase family protein [Niveomyces insectorum RCEF 264]